MASVSVTVRADTRRALWFINGLKLIAPIVGAERALRWGKAGVPRLVRFRIGDGPWRSLAASVAQDEPDPDEELDEDVKSDPIPEPAEDDADEPTTEVPQT